MSEWKERERKTEQERMKETEKEREREKERLGKREKERKIYWQRKTDKERKRYWQSETNKERNMTEWKERDWQRWVGSRPLCLKKKKNICYGAGYGGVMEYAKIGYGILVME